MRGNIQDMQIPRSSSGRGEREREGERKGGEKKKKGPWRDRRVRAICIYYPGMPRLHTRREICIFAAEDDHDRGREGREGGRKDGSFWSGKGESR